jgi:hypothetical protein
MPRGQERDADLSTLGHEYFSAVTTPMALALLEALDAPDPEPEELEAFENGKNSFLDYMAVWPVLIKRYYGRVQLAKMGRMEPADESPVDMSVFDADMPGEQAVSTLAFVLD